MNDPIDQHFVPKVYLKGFANSQRMFYQLKRNYSKVSQKSIAQVCYEKNYFTIQREETRFLNKVTDPYYIEKHSFKEQENLYEKMFKKLTFPALNSFQLPRSSVREFLRILITIKRRNPTAKEILTKNLRDYFNSDEFLADVKPAIEISKRIDKIDPEEYFKSYIELINSDPSKLSDVYLSRFLDRQQRVVEKVLDTLMQYKVFIYAAPL